MKTFLIFLVVIGYTSTSLSQTITNTKQYGFNEIEWYFNLPEGFELVDSSVTNDSPVPSITF